MRNDTHIIINFDAEVQGLEECPLDAFKIEVPLKTPTGTMKTYVGVKSISYGEASKPTRPAFATGMYDTPLGYMMGVVT